MSEDLFEKIKSRIENLRDYLKLTDSEMSLLLNHKRVSASVLKVHGKEYPAWRIVHNNSLGPGKGGIRFHPGVNEDEVKSLSFWMSIKNSLAGLPYGGGKGGVQVNPKELSQEELQELSREFVKSFHEVIGQDKDIPAPDVYTNPQIMAWMLDEFEKIKGHHEPGMITGKPLALGGIPLRGDSTSKGGVIVLEDYLKKKNVEPSKVTVAVQGFGNAGMHVSKLLHEDGFKVVAVSDSKGGIYQPEGLDVMKVIDTKTSTRTVTNYEASKVSNQEILELDVDVLVLAALENQVTVDNADKIKATTILELANGPITPKADDILHANDVVVIPDILANSGGVIGSYYEWVQNRTGQIFEDEYLRGRLHSKMSENFHKVYEEFIENDFDMRSAAYAIAIRRILEAEKLRGNI